MPCAELVTLERVGRVAKITLNMPDEMNAMTLPMADALLRIGSFLVADRTQCGAVVVTGAGSSFSAGHDLAWLRSCQTYANVVEKAQIMREFYDKFLRVRQIPLPIIAAINGSAIGAGLCFAMACDVRVAAKTAKAGMAWPGHSPRHGCHSFCGEGRWRGDSCALVTDGRHYLWC